MKRSSLIQFIIWMAFINGLALTLLSIQTVAAKAEPAGLLTWLYTLLQQIGHFQFLAFLIALLLIPIAIILPKQRILTGLTIISFSALALLIQLDIVIFRIFHFHLNGMVWNLLTGGAAGEIFVVDPINSLLAIGFLLLIITLQWLLARGLLRRIKAGKHLYGKWVATIVIILMATSQALHAWADVWQKDVILQQVALVPWPQPVTVNGFLYKKGWLPENRPEKPTSLATKGTLNYPKQPLIVSNNKSDLNLLVIVIDGFRWDMLHPEVTPNLWALRETSLTFEHHISSGNSTRFGIFGLFSGLYGAYWKDALRAQSGSVLISELQRQGYETGLFSSARLTSPEFHRTVFADIKQKVPEKTPGDTVVARDQKITDQVIKFMHQNHEERFFAFLFYDAPHAYQYPKQDAVFLPAAKHFNYVALNNNTDPLPLLNRYRNAVYFNDRLIGDVFQSIQQNNVFENTIIVVTGDHGQEMNETRQNFWGHNGNFSRYQVQVPMLIHWPGKPPHRYQHMTSHVDVVPTLMTDMLGSEAKISDYANGQSLFDQSPREFVMAHSWGSSAVITQDQTTVFDRLGRYSIRDKNYQKITDATLDGKTHLKVLNAVSWFYQ